MPSHTYLSRNEKKDDYCYQCTAEQLIVEVLTSFFLIRFSFMFVIQYMMPLCITVSFIYSVAILVQNIVHEKEQRLKEVMKMMGLNNAVHWTAWFITSTCLMTVIVLLMTLILKVIHLQKLSFCKSFISRSGACYISFEYFLTTIF